MSHLILYDGQCGLCDRMVRFLLTADSNSQFRFASLDGETAARVLKRWFPGGGVPDTVILVANHDEPDEQIFTGSDVIIQAGEILDGMYRALMLVKLIPRPIRDGLYRMVARVRRSLFGRVSYCPFVPSRSGRFLP